MTAAINRHKAVILAHMAATGLGLRTDTLRCDSIPAEAIRRLKNEVDRAENSAVMGPPCSSWGTAADRGPAGAIRSVRLPWGLPSQLLSARQQARLSLGNNI